MAETRMPPSAKRPGLDLQAHLGEMETRGLPVRINQPVNKDTELHPLVRRLGRDHGP